MKDIRKKVVDYVKETRAEVKKVSWPDRQFVTAASAIIIFIVVMVSAFIMFVDWGLAKIFLFLTKTF